MEDKGSTTFLTKATYDKSLFNDQINQEWDGEVVLQTEDQQRYNLRSKTNNFKETHVHKVVFPTKQ